MSKIHDINYISSLQVSQNFWVKKKLTQFVWYSFF